ncbi:FemAB family XrtA/PEP-CTERM system-associated protein [Allohahella marinimesophila]|uniref:BioF2-like acetyltransferase domain-containing protein n=1 Tax=Allohahella marinimesophila TaxID=1054972 RepID=A0ABP7Q8H3_9GAMM
MTDLTEQIQALTDESKKLSRLIGEAKKKGLDTADELIAQKKAVQASIAELEARATPESSDSEQPDSAGNAAATGKGGPGTGTVAAESPAKAKREPSDAERLQALIPPVYTAASESAESAQPAAAYACEVSEVSPPGWDDFVRQHPRATLYHESMWLRTVAETMGHQVAYVSCYFEADADRQLQSALPMIRQKSRLFGDIWTSIPLVNYGGALSVDKHAEKHVLKAAADFARASGASHLEVRGYHKQPTGWPERTDKVNMWLPLPADSKTLWKGFSSKVRSQIRKGQQNDYQSRIGGAELLDDFYRVFSENMRDLGTPVYGKAFFAGILKNFGSSAKLIVIYSKGQPASCGFLVEQSTGAVKLLEIPWASTRQAFNSQNMNMVMYWEILSHAADTGFDLFDFGRSSKDAGTYRFKKQWGAMPVQLYWHYALFQADELPAVNNNNPKFKLLVAMWQRLPLWLANRLGPAIVKYIP